jgi:hypothetical protein
VEPGPCGEHHNPVPEETMQKNAIATRESLEKVVGAFSSYLELLRREWRLALRLSTKLMHYLPTCAREFVA